MTLGGSSSDRPDETRLQEAVRLHQAGRLPEAEQGYLAWLLDHPEDIDGTYFLAGLRHQQGRPADAVQLFRKVVERDAGRANAWLNLGVAHKALRDLSSAAACFERAIALQPALAVAHFNLGVVQQESKQSAEALRCFDRAIELNPNHAKAYSNRAAVLGALHRNAEALASCDRALALLPDYAEAFSNRGTALSNLGRFEEALASYRRALALDAEHVNANYNEGLTKLRLGLFESGWPQCEYRWKRPQASPYRHASIPAWLGAQPLSGRSILLWSEQGYGDSIQFCRYAPKVAALGANVVIEVPAPLKELMGTLPGVNQVYAQDEAVPECDYQVPLLSLPLAFMTTLPTVPALVPYLSAERIKIEQWRGRLGPTSGLPRIGIACSGNPAHENDANRSMPLSVFAPLFETADLYLLQKELRGDDEAFLHESPIKDLRDELGDFNDTAALVENLDLVICVDTSVAHLAGALGKPVWILLSAIWDWRWMLDRADSPWYPTATLFRQQHLGGWENTMQRVAFALEHAAGKYVKIRSN